VKTHILVESQFSEFTEWELLLWPDLSEVEDAVVKLLRLLRCHGLNIDSPRRIGAFLNRLKEILRVMIWVSSAKCLSLFVVEGLVALVGLEMDLDIDERSIGLDELVGVSGVTVHMPVRVWSTAITEQVHNLVDGLLVVAEIVPEHGGILKVGLWVSLLCMDEDWKLAWVAEEEDWCVVKDPVEVTVRKYLSVQSRIPEASFVLTLPLCRT
jgi:hypothetical protein